MPIVRVALHGVRSASHLLSGEGMGDQLLIEKLHRDGRGMLVVTVQNITWGEHAMYRVSVEEGVVYASLVLGVIFDDECRKRIHRTSDKLVEFVRSLDWG